MLRHITKTTLVGLLLVSAGYAPAVAGARAGAVADGNRTANLPVDRQIRYAVGAQHQWRDRLSVGALNFNYKL